MLLVSLMLTAGSTFAQLTLKDGHPVFMVQDEAVISAPDDGLWSVATEWRDDWMCDWRHADPQDVEKVGEWTVLSGKMTFESGDLLLRDSYRTIRDGLVQCVRRYEWTGTETLPHVTLSVRWKVEGERMMPCLPGILYYGNRNGAKVNPEIIPVYEGTEGEFAIFEIIRFRRFLRFHTI